MNYFENSVLVWGGSIFYDASSFEKMEAAARLILDEFRGSKNYELFCEKSPYSSKLSNTDQMTVDMTAEDIASYPRHVQSAIRRSLQRIKKEQKAIAELNDLVVRNNAVFAIFDEEYENNWFTFKETKRRDNQPIEDFEKVFKKVSTRNPCARMVTRRVPDFSQWIEEPWTSMQVISEMQACGVFENFGKFSIVKIVDPEAKF